MKLITNLHRPLAVALLGAGALLLLPGCSGVYEDLDPCRNNAQVRLKFTRNMAGDDRYATDVHCARVLLYDANGKYISTHTPDGASLNIELTAGKYHAIALGGMHCQDSSFGFNLDPESDHNYFDLRSELGGTRAAVTESASPLHPHFQSFADFEIHDLPNAHVPVEIDFTKNTNHIRLEVSYKNNMPIAEGAYTATITADNAVIGHDGKIVKAGAPITYRPYSTGVELIQPEEAESYPCIREEFDIARIDADDSPVLKVYSASENSIVYQQKLTDLLGKAKEKEFPSGTMEEYLDRQDSWTISVREITANAGFSGVVITVNGWEIVKNNIAF